MKEKERRVYTQKLALARIIVPLASGFIVLLLWASPEFGIKAGVIIMTGLLLYAGFLYRNLKRYLLILLASLCFLNFLVFPMIYFKILEKDPQAFDFPDEMLSREQKEAYQEFKNHLDTQTTHERIILLKEVISELSMQSKSKSGFTLQNDDLILLDNYIIGREVRYRRTDSGPRPWTHSTIIYDKTGRRIDNLEIYPNNPIDTVLNDLKLALRKNRNSILETLQRETDIKENYKVWTFPRFFRYSLSMLTEGHIQPVSPKANIWYPLHKIIVGFFLLNAIFTVFLMLIEKRKPVDKPSE